MASTFKNAVSAAVGTTLVDVYTAPALTSTTIIGLSIANINTVAITVSVKLTKGATVVYLIKDAPVALGGSLVVVGGDQKIVLETSDKISVISNTASSADIVMSFLEVA